MSGINWGFTLQRLNRTPIDQSFVFNSLVEFETFLAGGGPAYAGQLVAVRNGTNFPDVYRVNEDFSYSPVGAGGPFGAVTSDQVTAGNSLTVTSAAGGWPVGATITATDTVWDVFRRLFNPVVPPTYTAPSLSLAGMQPLAREIGESITPTLTPTLSQNDGGPIEQYRLARDSTNIYTGPAAIAHTDTAFTLTVNVAYQAHFDHAQGPIKNDSEGEPYPTGRIEAGTRSSNTVTYVPQRRGFFGPTSGASIPNDSAYIRGLPQHVLNPGNGTVMAVNLVAGDRGACFAYPATIRAATSIIQRELNMNVINGFTATVLPVEGAGGHTAIDYRVYYFITEFPFTGPEGYTLTI